MTLHGGTRRRTEGRGGDWRLETKLLPQMNADKRRYFVVCSGRFSAFAREARERRALKCLLRALKKSAFIRVHLRQSFQSPISNLQSPTL